MEIKEGMLLQRKEIFSNNALGTKALIFNISCNRINAISEKGYVYEDIPSYIFEMSFFNPFPDKVFKSPGGKRITEESYHKGDLEVIFQYKTSNGPKVTLEAINNMELNGQTVERYNSRYDDLEYLSIIHHFYPSTDHLRFNEFRKLLSEDLLKRSETYTKNGEIYMLVNIFVDPQFKLARFLNRYSEWEEIENPIAELILAIFNIKKGDGEKYWKEYILPKRIENVK